MLLFFLYMLIGTCFSATCIWKLGQYHKFVRTDYCLILAFMWPPWLCIAFVYGMLYLLFGETTRRKRKVWEWKPVITPEYVLPPTNNDVEKLKKLFIDP